MCVELPTQTNERIMLHKNLLRGQYHRPSLCAYIRAYGMQNRISMRGVAGQLVDQLVSNFRLLFRSFASHLRIVLVVLVRVLSDCLEIQRNSIIANSWWGLYWRGKNVHKMFRIIGCYKVTRDPRTPWVAKSISMNRHTIRKSSCYGLSSILSPTMYFSKLQHLSNSLNCRMGKKRFNKNELITDLSCSNTRPIPNIFYRHRVSTPFAPAKLYVKPVPVLFTIYTERTLRFRQYFFSAQGRGSASIRIIRSSIIFKLETTMEFRYFFSSQPKTKKKIICVEVNRQMEK